MRAIALAYDEDLGCAWPPTAFDTHLLRVFAPGGKTTVSPYTQSVKALVEALKLDGRLEVTGVDKCGNMKNPKTLHACLRFQSKESLSS